MSGWALRAEFVNLLLAMAIGYDDLDIRDVEFDGIAGPNFDSAVEAAYRASSDYQRNDYINLALKLNVPVEGLVADGMFGEKWDEVEELVKQVRPTGM